jgi:hypothetical protein
VSGDEGAEMLAAYRSLFDTEPPIGTDGSPWPKARPYVVAWCPHRKRCRIGAVYATRWGYLWLSVRRRRDPDGGRIGAGYTLLTFPDGSRRSFGHVSSRGAGCRHGVPRNESVPFVAEDLFGLLDAVRSGRTPRPADYVAPWR